MQVSVGNNRLGCTPPARLPTYVRAVQIPASLEGDGNEITNPDAIETICYGTTLDGPLVEQFEQSHSPDKISSVYTYFGSWTGVTRIFPGRSYASVCGDFDNRVRPWRV